MKRSDHLRDLYLAELVAKTPPLSGSGQISTSCVDRNYAARLFNQPLLQQSFQEYWLVLVDDTWLKI